MSEEYKCKTCGYELSYCGPQDPITHIPTIDCPACDWMKQYQAASATITTQAATIERLEAELSLTTKSAYEIQEGLCKRLDHAIAEADSLRVQLAAKEATIAYFIEALQTESAKLAAKDAEVAGLREEMARVAGWTNIGKFGNAAGSGDDPKDGCTRPIPSLAELLTALTSELARYKTLAEDAKREALEFSVGHERYEFVRKLKPREFAELCRRNISGEGTFDDLVDAARSTHRTNQPTES